MRKLIVACALAGCANNQGVDASGNPAITTEEVDAIEAGQWNGGTNFSGTWSLKTKVTATNCVPVPSLPLPKKGDEEEETIVIVQNAGELTRGVDDVGSLHTFRGRIDGGGTEGEFEYGLYYDLASAVRFIEITEGTMQQPDAATISGNLTGTSRRRYVGGGLVDCSADLEVTGTRTLAGGGGDGAGGGGGSGSDSDLD